MMYSNAYNKRNRWSFKFAGDLLNDLRYAGRMLVKYPGFTLGSIAILALTIGFNTALFAFFDAYMLKPFPIKDPQLHVELKAKQMRGYRFDLWSYADFSQYRSQNQVFEELYAYAPVDVPVRDLSPRRLKGMLVSGNFFRLFQARAILGSAFEPEEDQVPGRDAVVVLSHHAWQSFFHEDPQIIGKTIRIRQTIFTIIGVTEPAFKGTDPFVTPDLWAPVVMRDQLAGDGRKLADPDNACLSLAGILKPEYSVTQAEESLRGLIRSLNAQRPSDTAIRDVQLIPRRTFISMAGEMMAAAAFIFAGLILVLLIACANLAGILLARATTRQGEIAIRASLGASRARLIRQLLTESILLAMIAIMPSILLAQWGITYIQHYVSSLLMKDGYYFQPVQPDWQILIFAALLALLAGIMLGLAPAMNASRVNLVEYLKDGSGTCSGVRPKKIREWLVVGQVAASLVLLVMTGIFIRSAQRVSRVDPGFDVDHVLSIRIDGPKRALIERLNEDPRVQAVSEMYRAPLDAHGLRKIPGEVEGRVMPIGTNYVDSRYFETLGIAVVHGRLFNALEARSVAPLAVISETTARTLWPRENPIGKAIAIVDPNLVGFDSRAVHWTAGKYEVIGVVSDVVSSVWSGQVDSTAVYLPAVPDDNRNGHLLVRIRDASPTTFAAIKKICSEADDTNAGNPVTLRSIAERLRLPFFIASSVSFGIGILALIMSCIGLFGVISFSVVQRTREIGIRLALGACPFRIVYSMVQGAILRVIVGVLLGFPLCIVFSKIAASAFLQVETFDLMAYTLTPLALAAVTIAAAYAPARRATRIDPACALRQQ